jgi:hypothetical protein
VLTEVVSIMDTDWASNIDRVLRRNLDPQRKRAEFRTDIPVEGLDFYDEIADVLLSD